MSRYIEDEWQSFKAAVLPTIAPPIQVQEMRRAFYGGAASMFHIMISKVSEGDEITPEDDRLGVDIQAEFDRFSEDLRHGKA